MTKEDAYNELRQTFDGQDPFMTKGHQIIKVRRGNRKTPDWAKNENELRKLLLHSFPYMATNKKQRVRAGRWARIINLYFRLQMTHGQIASEMMMSYCAVESAIRNIKRAAKGLKASGEGRYKSPTGVRTRSSAIS